MKIIKVVLVLAFAYASCANAQKKEPKFERVGNMIKAVFYHDNGQIAQVGCIKEGKLQGEWVMFAETGKKIAVGKYEEGKRTGNWFFWKINGEALREVTYNDGKLMNVVEWNHSNTVSL